MKPIITVIGPCKGDRTVLIEKIIPKLQEHGYRVATVKRDAHGYDLDTPGKTSWRHSQAGAQTVVVSSAKRITIFKKVNKEWSLEALAEEFLSDADIVIADGFASAKEPKIKVLLSETEEETQVSESDLFSIVGVEVGQEGWLEEIPRFSLNDIDKLADLIEEKFLKKC